MFKYRFNTSNRDLLLSFDLLVYLIGYKLNSNLLFNELTFGVLLIFMVEGGRNDP